MTKSYQDQSDSEIREQVNYWSTLPTQNRVDLGWLFESDKDEAINSVIYNIDSAEKLTMPLFYGSNREEEE